MPFRVYLQAGRELRSYRAAVSRESYVNVKSAAARESKRNAWQSARSRIGMTDTFTLWRHWLDAGIASLPSRVRCRLLWAAWTLVVGLSALALAATAFIARERWHERIAVTEQIAAAERVALPAAAATGAPVDFTAALPVAVDAERVVGELQRSAAAARVSLASLTVSHHPAAPDQLGRLDLDITLRGAYPDAKQVLVDVLGRFDAATLRSLRLRQEPGLTTAEVQVHMSVWSRPVGP
jgi:hypothetical protein